MFAHFSYHLLEFGIFILKKLQSSKDKNFINWSETHFQTKLKKFRFVT